MYNKLTEQGNTVRELKQSKAAKDVIDVAVKTLLSLKSDYKSLTGTDYVAGKAPAAPPAPSIGGSDSIQAQVDDQGAKVRKLKSAKAPKSEIDAAVKTLLELKAKFKEVTGQDYKPSPVQPAAAVNVKVEPTTLPAAGGSDLQSQVDEQGVKVRNLKSAKAPKPEIDAAVKTLLELKAKFKEVTGQDYKPSPVQPVAVKVEPASPPAAGGSDLQSQVDEQGIKVRTLKAAKAPKSEIDAAVKTLLELKAKFKEVTGQDYKPSSATPAQPVAVKAEINCNQSSSDPSTLLAQIDEQGNVVRNLKSAKAPKPEIDAAVKLLLELKGKYKVASGEEYKPPQQRAPADVKVESTSMSPEDSIKCEVEAQGNTVRQLKEAKASKGKFSLYLDEFDW